MKPILFNTEMVRALLDGRKTETRRVVKKLVGADAFRTDGKPMDEIKMFVSPQTCALYYEDLMRQVTMDGKLIVSPYQPDDILYVREAFGRHPSGKYCYRADYIGAYGWGWHPSIHMPKDAARIFLRVTNVRVERLQEISDDSIVKEGVGFRYTESEISSFIYRSFFKDLWNSTIKKSDYGKFGWDANPFVWVIEFERVAKG